MLSVAGLLLLLSAVVGVSYNNDWAAEIPGGLGKAREVAKHSGCSLESEIIPDSNIFQFRCHHVRRRSTEPHDQTHETLAKHEAVSWTEQQKVKSRDRRQFQPWGMGNNQPWGMQPPQHFPQFGVRPPASRQEQVFSDTPYEDPLHLNDEHWPHMWYLNRGNNIDMNVQEAWQMGVTGRDVVVTILDDGVERHNPDLVANYDPQASYDVNDNDGDPSPRYDLVNSNRHGTRCAGEVSASANNSVCAVGVAYNSKIGGVRMLDGDVTDAVEARAISLNNQHIDIYSASWGPDDDGKTVDGPGNLAKRAFINGIQNGRGGKGSIFVWASGNGGRDHDNCNCDGYTNSIWTLSVSSATENGLIPWYSEACSSTMATTYSSGSSGERKVVSTDLHNKCTTSHTGTSASAPMAAGLVALILEANPLLTWRDVQHITVRNCHVANLRATDWQVNAMGRNYSHSFGYGIMDAGAMVRQAKGWTLVPEQKSSAVNADIGPVVIPASSSRVAKMQVTDAGDVNFLEHVQAHITLTAARRGDVQILLTSPGGTRSTLLARRPHDTSRAGFQDWPFLTVFSWGENPMGSWQLEIQNDGRYQVELHAWSLTFHGTKTDPQPSPVTAPPPPPVKPAAADASIAQSVTKPHHVTNTDPVEEEDFSKKVDSGAAETGGAVQPGVPAAGPQMLAEPLPHGGHVATIQNCRTQSGEAWCTSCEAGYLVLAGKCVTSCPPQGYYQGLNNMSGHCLQCYYTCQSCSGPNDYQCLSCYGDAQLDVSPAGQTFCHNKNLIFKVFSSSRWYYILSLGFLVNTILIVVLLVYIYRRRGRAKGGVYRGNVLDRVISPGSKGYKQVSPSGDELGSSRPFHDNSSEDDLPASFVKPYTDNPKDRPYRDDIS